MKKPSNVHQLCFSTSDLIATECSTTHLLTSKTFSFSLENCPKKNPSPPPMSMLLILPSLVLPNAVTLKRPLKS
jgi:hypothetical protein